MPAHHIGSRIYIKPILTKLKKTYSIGCLVHMQRRRTMMTLLTLCAGNSPVTGKFPVQMPVTRSFDAFFGLHLNKRLSKQSWGWWFETPYRSLWRHWNEYITNMNIELKNVFQVSSWNNGMRCMSWYVLSCNCIESLCTYWLILLLSSTFFHCVLFN